MKTGFFDPIFAVVQDHPSVAAGTVTFAVAFALVAGNAFYAQSGTHPEPIWATRDATFTHSVDKTLRTVKTTSVKPRTMEVPVPVARADNPAAKNASKAKPSPLISAIQKALIATGDFKGEVDGLSGPVTRAAIVSYQKRNGFEETGKPSKLLLTAIEQSLPVASKTSGTLTGLIASTDGASSGKYDREMVRQIQAGLANKGLDITVDGIFGSQTKAAIAKFQKENSLDVTGMPDQAVLKTLKKAGALDS